jgi:aminoglycoside phosphotransferase (APT) family kinase protein
MALANTRDPADSARRLSAWLAGVLPGAEQVTVSNVSTPGAAGLSNETLMFEASWVQGGEPTSARLVARVAPSGPAVFPSYDLPREFRVMKALAEHTAVPVPRMRWLEEDVSVLGAPFIVMDRADGRIAEDDPPFTAAGWVLDELTPEQRRQMCVNSLTVLAQVHAVDWQGLGLGWLAPAGGGDPFDADLAHWTETFDWAREGDGNPTVEAGLEWLAEHRPPESGPVVLNWGDARIGNMLFGADLAVNAVLDWEMVGVGRPEIELAWWLFMVRHHTEGIGVPLPEGILTREEAIEVYEQASGHPVRELDYYEVWAAVRLAILMHRAGNLMIAAGMLPAGAPMKLNNPASQLLAKLIGVEAPTGEAQSFIGNR